MKEAQTARAVFNSEPGRPGGGVVTGRKGGVFMRLDVTGKAAHAGNNLADGISAIEEIARKIVKLHALTDLPNGISCNVGTITGGQTVNTVAPACERGGRSALHPARGPHPRHGGDRGDRCEQQRAGRRGRASRSPASSSRWWRARRRSACFAHYAACAACARPDRRADVRRRVLRCRLRLERRRADHLRRRPDRRPCPFAGRISRGRFDRAARPGPGARHHAARTDVSAGSARVARPQGFVLRALRAMMRGGFGGQ